MSISRQRTIDIVDPEHIVSTLSALIDEASDATICFDHSPVHYPVQVVARDAHAFTLEATNLVDLIESLNRRTPFQLHAQQSSESLCFEVTSSDTLMEKGNRIAFSCAIPLRLHVERRRTVFRAPLDDKMRVKMLLRADTQTSPVEGALRNLSLGGCLVELPHAQARTFDIGAELYRLDALFPNGSSFNVPGRIQHVRYSEQAGMAQLGIEFLTQNEAFERYLWYFVREVEREAARRTAQNKRKQRIQPSRLFQPEADDNPR